MKEYCCDLCGSEDAIEVPYSRLYTNNQPIHICKTCGFVYVKKRRSSREIADSWSTSIFGTTYTARIPAIKARQTYVADYIDSMINLKDKSIVDIGSGEGQFLEIAKNHYGALVFGIEPSVDNCKAMRDNGIECFGGTIEDYAACRDSKKFDIVTIMWTLENCVSCRAMIDAGRDLLVDNGRIVVATGSRILVPFKKPLWDYLKTNQTDTHAFRFSVNTLTSLLRTSGFDITRVNRYLDTDYLVVIGQKSSRVDTSIKVDHYLAVHNFFERWHNESVHYLIQHDAGLPLA